MTANYKLVYHGNKANLPAVRDAGSFYLTDDTRELYFGDKKYGEGVRFYTSAEGKPATPAEGVIYVNTDTGVGEVYNGSAWVVVIKGYATAIGENADNSTVPTSKAMKDYTDAKVAEAAGADLLFAPSPAEMYPHKDMTWVEVTGPITKVLCGRTRPIHFRGVATVCTKFFNLTECDRAYYGLKDAQQTQVLQRMVEDLFMNVELRLMPIVREADGLAKSSRNVYLSKEERTAALVLSRSLSHAKEAFEAGERNKQKLIDQVTKEIEAEPMSDIDYVEMYGMPGLPEVGETITGKTLLAVAVKFGKTRLIDNIVLEAE